MGADVFGDGIPGVAVVGDGGLGVEFIESEIGVVFFGVVAGVAVGFEGGDDIVVEGGG